MLFALTKRVLTEADLKVVAKFVYNFGVKGVRSVELHKRRRRRGENFPPFLFISVISSCQLRCQGCWVDVAAPTQKMSLDELNRIVDDAKAHGNAYFGILGGEPFLHPDLLDLFAAHPDCYFQVFTNGQLITDEVAQRLARLGNVTPLISIEGSEIFTRDRSRRSHAPWHRRRSG
jgi:MoaA/NifB/PqqE/SkfB family radical SAM enzyme